MREMVYLSDAKLKEFLPDLRSLWPRPKLSLKAPFGGMEVDFQPSEQRAHLQQLDKIVSHIGLTAGWFTDPAINPGQWVAFESPLYYFTPGSSFWRDLLLFASPKELPNFDPSGIEVRLLLHGSKRHLLGTTFVDSIYKDGPDRTGVSSYALDFLSNIGRLLEELEKRSFSIHPTEDNGQPGRRTLKSRRASRNTTSINESPLPDSEYHRNAVRNLFSALERKMAFNTAAQMSGYARVSANITDEQSSAAPIRYVVASPLYVERLPTYM